MSLNRTVSTRRETDRDVPVTSIARHLDGETADQELEALQRAVAEARRHSWNDPDPIEPELENFLAALNRTHDARDAAPQPRPNSWREVLEDVG